MAKLSINEVYPKGSTYPMIINFQNGYTTKDFKDIDCNLYSNENNERKTVVTEVGDLLYAGTEEKAELGKTLILARNKRTGKVRLIEVGCVDLKPILTVDLDTSQLLETSNLELSRKFGSKKQKQQMEQREKLKINTETVTEQMHQVTENISDVNLDLTTYTKTDDDDFYVPPINRKADKVEDVYNISTILTDEEYKSIEIQLEENDFMTELLPWTKSLVLSKNTSLTKKQQTLFLFANCLIKTCTMLMKDVAKKNFVACQSSTTLNSIILMNFFTKNSGRLGRPNTYKDKALCHAIVLLLLANNFKFDLDGLCQCTKMTANTLSLKVRVTGAHVISSGSSKIVQLKLPLNTKSGFRRKSAKF